MNSKRSRDDDQKIFVSDCEGPISKNDNAFELTEHFVPDGDEFFALISKYDDVLADVIKKTGYRAGNTLKLIVPFLKAYGATDEGIIEYSSTNMLLVPGARGTLRFVDDLMPSFIVSTSYEPYIDALCHITDFPPENTFSTELNIDKYEITEDEIRRLKELREEVGAMPMIEIPENAETLDDFSRRDRRTIERLDEVFWEEIPKMESRRILEEVNPVGDEEKAKAVREIVKETDGDLSEVMYVGDSITDVAPLQLVRESGGLTVSFNGNEYAIREAEVAVLASNTIVTSILAHTFDRSGKRGVVRLVKEWDPGGLKEHCADPSLVRRALELYPEGLPEVEMITDINRETLSEKSCNFRKRVRGESVGKLG